MAEDTLYDYVTDNRFGIKTYIDTLMTDDFTSYVQTFSDNVLSGMKQIITERLASETLTPPNRALIEEYLRRYIVDIFNKTFMQENIQCYYTKSPIGHSDKLFHEIDIPEYHPSSPVIVPIFNPQLPNRRSSNRGLNAPNGPRFSPTSPLRDRIRQLGFEGAVRGQQQLPFLRIGGSKKRRATRRNRRKCD